MQEADDGHCAVDIVTRPSASFDYASESEITTAALSIFHTCIRRDPSTGGTRTNVGECLHKLDVKYGLVIISRTFSESLGSHNSISSDGIMWTSVPSRAPSGKL